MGLKVQVMPSKVIRNNNNNIKKKIARITLTQCDINQTQTDPYPMAYPVTD